MSWKDCEYCVLGTCVYATHNRKARASHKGHRYYRPPLPRCQVVLSGDAMKKPVTNVGGESGAAAAVCDLCTRWTHLYEFLTVDKWDDGSKRAPGTVLVMYEEGSWKCMLNDKALQRLAFITGPTWEEVMNRADDAVRTNNADWRKAKKWSK